jgi:hypothetical protein
MTSVQECAITAKELYSRWIDELWAGQPVVNEVVADDFVGHWPDREVHGPDELASIIDMTRTMFTDLRFVVEVGPFVEGDLLAARWIGTGASPEGPKRFTGNDMLKISNGRIVEYWTGTSEG